MTQLKDAGNDCHFSSNVADLSSNGADPPDHGNDLLLQKSFLLGMIGMIGLIGLIGLLGSRKT